MIWFYERDHIPLRVEQRFDNVGRTFVLILKYADGQEEVTRFATLASFRDALVALEQRLTDEQWRRIGGPLIVEDGWPNKPLT